MRIGRSGRTGSRAGVLVMMMVLPQALSCSRGPEDPIQILLEELEAAAEERDAERFGAWLSEDFETDRGMGRAEAVSSLRRYFAAYESVDLEAYGLEVERYGSEADVRLVAEFAGEGRSFGGLRGLLPPSAVYRFELGLEEEDEGWRVRTASWERVQPDLGP